MPAYLLVADADGLSVLTAWAAGKFDAEKIAKTVKAVGHRRAPEPQEARHPRPRRRALRRAARRSCPAGRSSSARARRSTSRRTSRPSGQVSETARDGTRTAGDSRRPTRRRAVTRRIRRADGRARHLHAQRPTAVASGGRDAARRRRRGRRARSTRPAAARAAAAAARSRSRATVVRAPPERHLSAAEVDAGYALACQTLVDGDVVVTVPPPRSVGQRPRGHAIAEPRRCRSTCDWRSNPAVRHLRPGHRAALAGRQHERLRPAAAGAGRQHGIKDVRAELPHAAPPRPRPARRPTGRSPSPSRCATGCTAPTCRRVSSASTRASSASAAWASPSTSARRRVVAYLVDFDDGARRRHARAPTTSQIACGDDVISRIIYAQRDGGLRAAAAARRRDDQRAARRAAASATGIELRRDPRGRRRRQHDHDPPAARPRPALPPRGALHPHGLRAAQAGGRRARPATSTRWPASTACPRSAATSAATSPPGVISSGLYATDKLTAVHRHRHQRRDGARATRTGSSPAPARPARPSKAAASRCGMRATAGAIEDVWIDSADAASRRSAPSTTRRRVGICGSGLIDLVAELFITGVIDKGGRIRRDLATPRVRESDGGVEYVVAWADETGDGRDIAAQREPTSATCCAPRRPSMPASPSCAAASASTWPTSSSSSSAAPSASTSTSRRRSASACCPTCRPSASASSATPAPWAPTPRCSA